MIPPLHLSALLLGFVAALSYADHSDDAVLLTVEEVRTHIRDKAPNQTLALQLFAKIYPLPTLEGAAEDRALIPRQTTFSISTFLPRVLTTGDPATDEMVQKQNRLTAKIVDQGLLHLRLADLIQPEQGSAHAERVAKLFRHIVDTGADGVFEPLNAKFLRYWALRQFRAELLDALRQHLQSGLRHSDPASRLVALQEGIELAEAQLRERQLYYASFPSGTIDKIWLRRFVGARDEALCESYTLYLDEYLSSFSHQQRGQVQQLISGAVLREVPVRLIVLNWCLNQVETAEELRALLVHELRDTTFSRYQSLELSNPLADPLALPKHEYSAADPQKHLEDLLFRQLLEGGAALFESKFSLDRAELFGALAEAVVHDPSRTSVAFELETLLFHFERLAEQSIERGPADAAAMETALRLVELRLSDEKSAFAGAPWRSGLLEATQSIREDAYIRARGWFPAKSGTFTEVMEVWLQGESRGSLQGRAALRVLSDVPSQYLDGLVSDVRETRGESLRADHLLASGYANCAELILQTYDRRFAQK